MRAWINSNRRIIIALGVAAVACAGIARYAAVTAYFAAAGEPPVGQKPEAPVAVAALGRIEPRSEIISLGAGVGAGLGAGVASDRLDSLLVARGDLVKKGQILGYLGGYAEQKAQIDMLRAELNEAHQRLSTEIQLDRARIEAAELHQKQIEEVSPRRITAQQATVASLEAKLANDKDILASQSELYGRGATSRRLNDDQKAMVAQGEANLASARARLSELEHQFQIDQIDAKVQIFVARAQLERAAAEVPIASLEGQIAVAEEHARRLTLYAPIGGRILNVKILPGEDVSGGPVLIMGDTGGMRAVAEVYETDIARVQLGQMATISSRALPHPISGKVVRIGDMVFKNDVLNVDPAARADARVVQVWIDLNEPQLTERLTNLTVDVTINTDDANGHRP